MARRLSFSERFGREAALLVRSPGRINLIGEHTDYNLGYVLPAAIDRYTKFATAPRNDRILNVYSEAVGDGLQVDLDGPLMLLGESDYWGNFVRGAAWWLRENGHTPAGADILIWGDLPQGIGLASSASLMGGLLSTMSLQAGLDIPKVDLARAAHEIETDFIGLANSMVDQMVVALNEPRSALLVDCRSWGTTPVPLNLAAQGLALVVVDSGVSRDPVGSINARRRKECEAAVGALKVITYNLELQSLRDVSLQMLSKHGNKLYPTLYKRARHVVTENERVLQTVSALSANDYQSVGELMAESCESLRSDFEVSNAFVDRLVELADQTEGVLGARLTGESFAGCTLNLVKSDALHGFDRNVVRRYREETSLHAEMYVVRPVGGVEVEQL